MAFDLGDVVSLQFASTDAAGTAADVGAAVATVTLPDGTTSTPSVVHAGTGSYTAAFTTTLAGRHAVRWLATGSNAQAFTDAFLVASADPGMIISVAYAKKGLGQSAVSATDEDLRDLIEAATAPMEDLCGPILQRSCDEWYDGGSDSIVLDWAPVLGVSAVLEAYGSGYHRALTEQVLDGSSFDAFGYTVDKPAGVVTRRSVGVAGVFVPGRRNVHVVYTAGRVQPLGTNLARATRLVVRWLWQTEMQGQRPSGSTPQTVVTPGGYTVPAAVKVLCGADLRPEAMR